ncbi:MAG: 6,7-dimethyl-8-ribityllumazine synthase [Bacteroidetes bacterium]|nr:6,7-dimethyl-8-ribityllumazine synthase [Bacteroidota bacterium]
MAHSHDSKSLLDITTIKEKLHNARVAIVSTEWNEAIVAEQMRGCERILSQCQATIVHHTIVPGSFEIPFACKQIGTSTNKHNDQTPEAIIAFGAVIRGGTPHFDYVCKAITEGILQLNLSLPIPIIFGVLTLDNEQQAWNRLGGTHGHKGEEAAISALKMIELCRNQLNKYPL